MEMGNPGGEKRYCFRERESFGYERNGIRAAACRE